MAEYYGWLKGNRGTTTRAGSKKSGITATIQSYHNRFNINLYPNEEGEDVLRITYTKQGTRKIKIIGLKELKNIKNDK